MFRFHVACLAAALCAAPAAAAVFAELPNREAQARLETRIVAAGDGYWVQGISVSGVDFTRYSTAGQQSPAIPVDAKLKGARGTEDGGVVLFPVLPDAAVDGGCLVERRDAQLATRWRRLLVGECAAYPSGEWTWVRADRRIVRFDRDGAQVGSSLPEYDNAEVALFSPGGGDIVLAMQLGSSVRVQRVRPDGSVAWSQSLAMPGPTGGFQRLEGDADALLLFAAGGPNLVAMLATATGDVRWQRTTDLGSFRMALGPQRAWLIARGGSFDYLVVGYARDTGEPRTLALPGDAFYDSSALLALPDGSILVPGVDPGDGVRAGPNDTAVAPFDFGGSPQGVARLADGTHRIAVARFDAAPELVAIGTNGAVTRAALPATALGHGFTSDIAVSASGRVLVHATSEADGARDTMLAADGTIAWSQPAPVGQFAASVALDDELACSAAMAPGAVQAPLRVSCRAQGDGALRWQREIANPQDGPFSPIRLAGGSLVTSTYAIGTGRTTIRRFDRNGGETSTEVPGFAFDVSRSGLVLVRDGVNGLTLYGPQGLAGSRPVADEAVFAVDSDALALRSGNVLRRVAADGTLRSQSTLTIGFEAFPILANDAGTVVASRSATTTSTITVARYYDAATGVERWSRALPYPMRPAAIDGSSVVFTGTFGTRSTRTVLALADGSIRLQADAPCGRCLDSSVRFDGQGRPYTVVRSQSLAPTRIYRDTLPEPLRAIDARSIAGAWYSPNLPGDGLVAMRDPASGTIFAAWFTYGTAALAGGANQRWLTLQGNAPAGATAEVDVFTTRDGRFDQPGGTTTSRVGRATLRLVGCDRLEIEYDFQLGSETVTNRRTFERLTDPGHACEPQAPAVAGAHDWRQSGAWFEPATSGQGVLFSIDPAGVAFGAWFTYDRDGAVDDGWAQQWFTLQSGGPVAAGGALAMPIYSTFDGRFDRRPGVATLRVGEASVRFTGCDRAQVDYRFDATAAAGAMSGATGSLALERIGGCP